MDLKKLKKELATPPSQDPKLRAFIINALNRLVWSRHPSKKLAKERCRVEVEVGTFKNGNTKTKVMYRCEECGTLHENLDCDHVTPRIDPQTGWVDYDTYIDRTFVQPEDLRMLCKDCHAAKTAEEHSTRAKTRRRRKNA